jgi:glycosyltransferase involved in cell wall biosynthesis
MTANSRPVTIQDLPPPPEGRTGWPWTEGSAALPTEGVSWPRITVITPSYMQGEFLEQTIRSVLLQGYPNLEYLVLDGGSTDRTREVIRKYEPWLSGWRSEKDGGQAAAINEGWARATGEIVAWICSDDFYLPDALGIAGAYLRDHPEVSWVGGTVNDCDLAGNFVKAHPAKHTPLAHCMGRKEMGFFQPAMFWRKAMVEKIGKFDPKMYVAFDQDFWLRSLVAGYRMETLPQALSMFRVHEQSKSCFAFQQVMATDWQMLSIYGAHLTPAERRAVAGWLKDYEADYVVTVAYRLLLVGRRGEALMYLLKSAPLIPRMRPPKLWFGALFRVLGTGRPPAWFGA